MLFKFWHFLVGSSLAAIAYWLLCPVLVPLDATTVIKGKNIIVTGASQGIGKALVYEYAKRQAANIVITSRSTARLQVIQQDIMQNFPSTKVHVISADLSSETNAKALLSSALELLQGRLDVLLLNHITSSRYGTWFTESSQTSTAEADTLELFQVNTLSYIWLATHATEALSQAPQGGSIGVVSSLAGFVGIPKTAVYAATKHALHGFFDAFRLELQYSGLQDKLSVTLCAIGATDTETSQLVKDKMDAGIQWDPPSWAAEAIVRGVAARKRLVYHPHHIVFPAVQIFYMFPELLEGILLKTMQRGA